ncbi:MAG: hypothetical protein ACI4J5_10165 [Oscillospiraceae bacterium]
MILAESKNYIITNEYESVYLTDRHTNTVLSEIADMYGDPEGAFISDDEGYCVVYGCGAVVYMLCEPFLNYGYEPNSRQWFDIMRDGDMWFTGVVYSDAEKLVLRSEDGRLFEADIIQIPNKSVDKKSAQDP